MRKQYKLIEGSRLCEGTPLLDGMGKGEVWFFLDKLRPFTRILRDVSPIHLMPVRTGEEVKPIPMPSCMLRIYGAECVDYATCVGTKVRWLDDEAIIAMTHWYCFQHMDYHVYPYFFQVKRGKRWLQTMESLELEDERVVDTWNAHRIMNAIF